ncbi:sugar ABC transporter substrate-binding protein (plasmid) [Halostagnicola larsenii XH-48]|uniref:Sugar ABC transporter substrate-binding protein n=1 Tax=Halostagnicola larsenii XH-48 TaxID=797299 RepID=W0JSE8_9EURY|nr:extracellular solute-binding protein [Halostagnicola larsenii]AHG01611.1 sugar ABC transporter substrate-binding protein [Halostagnicola larsenii XH-48]
MPDNSSQGTKTDGSSVSRRTVLNAAGAAGVTGASVGLAGCIYGGSSGADGVVWGFDPDAADAVGDEIIDLLSENGLDDDIDVTLQPGDSDTGARRDTYTNLLQAEETQPDLFLMDNGWVNTFIQRGDIANLSEELEQSELDRIDEEYFEAFTETARDPGSGDLYGVPLFPDYATMQYRKDFAREAGYDDEDFEEWATEPMTWSEWADVTEDIVANSDASYGLATQFDTYEGTACCSWNEVMTSFGGAYFGGEEHLLGPVGDRPITVDEPEFIEALSMMYTFVADERDDNTLEEYPTELATSSITSWTEEDARQAIASGEAAMQRNWPYAIVDTIESDENDVSADDYGAMPMPYAVSEDEAAQPGAGGTTSALGGWHVVLNPNSERKEDALEVMRTTMADDFNLGLFEIWGWIPPKPGLFETEQAAAVEPIGDYMETLRVAGENAIPRPATTEWTNQSGVIATEVNRAVAGEKSPADAAADLQESLEETES